MIKSETEAKKLLPNQMFLRCPKCETAILVLPNIEAMTKAINQHAKLHSTRSMGKAKIVNNLSQQLLVLVSKTEDAKLPQKVWLLVESYFGVKRVRGVALCEGDAECWVNAQVVHDPSGSYFYESGEVVRGGLP